MQIHEMFPYLRVRDAGRAITFYEKAFGATEKFRLVEPGGRIGHAELLIGSATLMLSEEFPEYGILGPKSIGGTSCSLHLHVDDADSWLRRGAEAGGEIVRPPQDHFYGERSGTLRDPFGHEWLIGHQLEALSPEEMQRRYEELMRRS